MMTGVRHKLLATVFALLSPFIHIASSQDTIRPPGGNNNGRCEALTSTFCANVGYTSVYLPNARGHDTQDAANEEVDDFAQLVSSGCSDALYIFLCSYYLPLCFTNPITNQPTQVKTCRNLCQFVRSACEPTLTAGNYPWPAFLDCSLSDFSDDPSCFGPVNLRNLSILGTVSNIEVTVTSFEELLATTIHPSATTTIVPITPTSTSQPTVATRESLDGTDDTVVTTTSSLGVRVAKGLTIKSFLVTLALVVFICNYLQ